MTDNIILRSRSEFHGIQSFTGMRIDRTRKLNGAENTHKRTTGQGWL